MPQRLALTFALLLAAFVGSRKSSDFVIDESKPYAYINFDHTGRRVPLTGEEDTRGLWLRFVNNCRVPISVRSFDPGTSDPGVGLFDDVVKVSRGLPARGGTIPRRLPEGYWFEVSSSTTILPGDNVLFSVPLDHVSQDWYLRVEFQLDPPKKGIGPQPYSYVDFSWGQIPEKYRDTSQP